MTRYIALLRGVNVGAHHRVTMEALRALLTDLGLTGVGTYIQSGNAFFDSDDADRADLESRVEAHLSTALGFQVPVFLRTVPEVATLVESNPFAEREVSADMRPAVTFTREPVPSTVDLPVLTPRGDLEVIHTTRYEIFTIWHLIGGRPPTGDLPKGFVPGPVTTRFFGALTKILAAAGKPRA